MALTLIPPSLGILIQRTPIHRHPLLAVEPLSVQASHMDRTLGPESHHEQNFLRPRLTFPTLLPTFQPVHKIGLLF
jgi:hypothetical protein